MTKQEAERTAILTAGVVILALTAVAFWLSYAHLADVAKTNGLAASPARTWAWPATLDLFIVAGEVLMFRAALRGVTDWWAIGLTVAGSLGSIGLNVAGVGSDAPILHYVVAGVPPFAALLAFGALMRQVHHLVAAPADDTTPAPAIEPEPAPAPEITVERTPEPAPDPEPVPELPPAAVPEHAPVPAVAVPPALLDHARKLADTHHATTGNRIDPDTLRVRLGVPPLLANVIAAQLT
ncbi:DUF2637 domain-containing protein [Streptomyces scopuliridis]|uniref:DUF2637 domain-containing protein n=1 Tax=Streptomyces scopuliridis TaxID=452529 RepID=UPI002DDBB275|nr:DUF2637 domain-containing protein [Streptomyces scopuliridis]WSB35575.1 DUF2637 domain-containing protein [Streptomyces scopuliridis]